MMSEPIIRFDNVSKVFDAGAPPVTALRDISLQIAPREFVALIGPSGCGKSSLLRLVADLVAPTQGTIVVNGKSPRQARLDHEYGIVFQAPVLFDWRLVRHNVELPLEVIGVDPARRARRAEALLDLVGLAEFGDAYPWQLSGGMQQRVAIARALAPAPAILLMDEPFSALDEMTREQMQQELLRVWERTGATVLFVTHSIAEAVFISDRVVVLSPRPGRVVADVLIDLPRPRDAQLRDDQHFFALTTRVRQLLRSAS